MNTQRTPKREVVLSACYALLELIGLFIPPDFHAEWKREWRAELWQRWQRLTSTRTSAGVSAPLRLLRDTCGALPDALSLWPWSLDILMNDVRYALRAFRRQFGFSSIVVGTIALAIGTSTTIFSVFSGVLLRPLPYRDADQLVRIWSKNVAQHYDEAFVSPLDLEDWTRSAPSFSSLAGYSTLPSGLTITGTGEPERLVTAYVTDQFFNTLGTPSARGRVLGPDQHVEGANHAIVISDGLWRRRFGTDSTLVGRTVLCDGEPFVIAGIMPPRFAFPSARIEVWAPSSLIGPTKIPRSRGVRWLSVVGRMRDGVTISAAHQEMDALSVTLAVQYPEANKGWNQVAMQSVQDQIVRDIKPALVALFAAVLVLMLLACVNVANLLLSRATTRVREIALRTALGAVRSRVIRQLLTESVMLAAIGGALGVLIATVGVPFLVNMSGGAIPRAEQIGTDWRVLSFALALSLGTGILFGIAPAFKLGRADMRSMLGDGGRTLSGGARTVRLRSALVVAQVALALCLTTAAGLTVKSFRQLASVNPGIDAEHTLAARFTIRLERFATSGEYLAFYRQVVDRVAAIPGVTAVGGAKVAPLFGNGEPYPVSVAGLTTAGAEPKAGLHPITPRFFAAIGMHILRGRAFDDRDNAQSPRVTIINETMAKRIWGSADPVGATLRYGPYDTRIVGIVSDVRQTDLDSLPRAEMYVPVFQDGRVGVTLITRAVDDPALLIPAVRTALHELDPDMAITYLAPMRDALSTAIEGPRFVMVLLALFGGSALLLAAIGLYGVIAHNVSQRTHEIGIRVALGARRGRVVGTVIAEGMRLALSGIALGLVMSFALGRLLTAQLYNVSPTDPATLIAIASLLAMIALVASFIPARRAAQVDPMRALRGD